MDSRNDEDGYLVTRNLAESSSLYKAIVDQAPIPMAISKPDGELFFNPACTELLQLPYKKGVNLFDLDQTWAEFDKHNSRVTPEELPLFRAMQGHITTGEEYRVVRKDGSERWEVVTATPVYDKHNKLIAGFAAFPDITDLKLTEKALLRSQKMEAVGQMAGGIAHDFNNILGIILGNLNLLGKHTQDDKKSLKRIATINKVTLRAADLTKQLLGFSRQQPRDSTATNINQIIEGMSSLISRSLTPEVEVVQYLSDELCETKVDSGDFEDSLFNLVLNARDAMIGGGILTITTTNCNLDKAYCNKHAGSTPGEYIRLTVSDTGKGITTTDLQKIFEPFFTTKPKDKGTGLGLAMVFGFIKRSDGFISVESNPGVGSTFDLYLPKVVSIEKPVKKPTQISECDYKGEETILVVDDEKALLALAEDFLQPLGYNVITCSDGKQAIKKLSSTPDCHLLFSDIVMPGGVNGYMLAKQAREIRPDIKILLTSGYNERTLVDDTQADLQDNILKKPYHRLELLQGIRGTLDDTQKAN